jgi:hypothetical protein
LSSTVPPEGQSDSSTLRDAVATRRRSTEILDSRAVDHREFDVDVNDA